MKFHCDRCKTRYSIADERVRGKILKIRCKNCSAVITVREDMEEAPADAAPPAKPALAARPAAAAKPAPTAKAAPAARGSALRGAFEQVMARPTQNPGAQADPSPSQSFRAPDHFEEEWYVSEDGDQVGPFSLRAAKEWVLARSPEAELYCWQEDFDDWLPVDKVSHFRGLRARAITPVAPRPGTAPPPVPGRAPAGALGRVAAGPIANPDPQPLFTATMNRLEQEQRKRPDDPPGPTNGKGIDPRAPAAAPNQAEAKGGSIFPDDDPDDLDLDIGEASRIVNLAMIMPTAAGGGAEPVDPRTSGAGLPGVAKLGAGRQTQSVARIGRGSGEQVPVGMPPLSDGALADAHPPILTPVAPPKKVPLVMLLLIGGALLAGLVGVLIYVAMSSDHGGDERLARSSVSGEEFARRGDYDPFRPPAAGDGDGEGEVTAPATENGTASRPSVKRPVTTRDKPITSAGDGDVTGPRVPGDLGVEGLTALRPQEVITMSSKQGLGTRRCYERALKKDPFLDVKNIKVQLTVAPSGVVTEVKLANQAQSFLGQCLAATIRTWPFRKSTNGITMDVTLSFEQQG
ncbi:MAG TPA: AgmX/PglI C-terminal domain-containing protein [Kofleriaceae bacterium]|nr:AgmX/PglI C-terminal domain-containing protein [Kofleriaceae bacterium]